GAIVKGESKSASRRELAANQKGAACADKPTRRGRQVQVCRNRVCATGLAIGTDAATAEAQGKRAPQSPAAGRGRKLKLINAPGRRHCWLVGSHRAWTENANIARKIVCGRLIQIPVAAVSDIFAVGSGLV